jgi:hypothetical protein
MRNETTVNYSIVWVKFSKVQGTALCKGAVYPNLPVRALLCGGLFRKNSYVTIQS